MGTIHRQTSDAASPRWSYPTVPLTDYSTAASPGVTKQVLLGEAEGAADFIVRYFTLPPGGRSAYDQHRHQHGVVVTHGTGRVLLGEAVAPDRGRGRGLDRHRRDPPARSHRGGTAGLHLRHPALGGG